jgi:DNA invertase Pin-like site-specific DNA recombinase
MRNQALSSFETQWNVAAYIRLSKEDEKKKGYGGDSESVENQRGLLLRYIADNGLMLAKEYVDDGITGTTFDRPAFKEMIGDIEAGLINMVVTKDLSRLGREYIDCGHYIERYFPEKGVRYISLLDNIDTFLDNSNNDIAPFKSILNDMYSKDLSKKIRSVLKSKKEQGKFLGKVAPYGYQKSPDDKHQLIVDSEAAVVVQEIFGMYCAGLGTTKIANILSERGISIPAVHNQINVGNASLAFGLWNNNTVKKILQNELYTGTLVQNRYKKLNYKSKKLVRTNPDDWIITPDAHEAIIRQEVFDNAQRLIEINAGLKPSKHNFLLSGLFRCADCGSFMAISPKRGRFFARCGRYIKYHKFGVCTPHSFSYSTAEEHILEDLRQRCEEYLDVSALSIEAGKQKKDDLTSRRKSAESEIIKLQRKLEMLYNDRLDGVIAVDQYKILSNKFSDQIKQLKKQCDDTQIVSHDDVVREFIQLKEPTKLIMAKLIDRIEVKEGGELDIYYRFVNS